MSTPAPDVLVKGSNDEPILTLEPLIDAVRAGVEPTGWALSGLQKTTSHQFEGRWEGEATRSAYLFFHLPAGPDHASIDVYLDETSRGLSGNLALVVDLAPLRSVCPVEDALRTLADCSSATLDAALRRPVTLRFRLADAGEAPGDAETEVRFKLRIPVGTIRAGHAAVAGLATDAMTAFFEILASDEVVSLAATEEAD